MKLKYQNNHYLTTTFLIIGLCFFYLLQQLPLIILQLALKSHLTPYQITLSFGLSILVVLTIMWWSLTKAQTFPTQKLSRQSFLLIGLAFILVIVINAALLPLMKTTGNTNVNSLLHLAQASPVLFVIYAIFIAPITEEILFRGLIINWFFADHLYFGALVSAILFGLVHLSKDPIYFLSKFSIGLLLGILYVRTKNIKSDICLHLLNNLAAIIMAF